METNTNVYPANKSARLNGLVKEVIAWILVIGLFTTFLTYNYIWPWVVLTPWQLTALWLTGGLLTLIPFVQKYFLALRLRFEQDLLIRFIFMVPTFISVLLVINRLVPIATYRETHTITGTYEVIIWQKKVNASHVGIILENNAYGGVEKIRTMHPRLVPAKPQQITYTFSRGMLGIKFLRKFYLE